MSNANEHMTELEEKLLAILPKLITPDFKAKYYITEKNIPDCYVFNGPSRRGYVIEVVARFDASELVNIGKFEFKSQSYFEDQLEEMTHSSEKPNPQLVSSRPWDVALNLILKVQDLSTSEAQKWTSFQLRREYLILQHMWDSFDGSHCPFSDMMGIPIVFDFKEVGDDSLRMSKAVKEMDEFGQVIPMRSLIGWPSRLSHMTMEKMGPRLSYILEVNRVAKGCGVGCDTAFKVFDQLLCRIVQMHRLGVLHNGICPKNVYFGRHMAFNVVYVSGFKMSHLMPKEGHDVKPRVRDVLVKDIRFAATDLFGNSRVHPSSDIESAFYTLVAMLCDSLPWDRKYLGKQSAQGKRQDAEEWVETNSELKKMDELSEVNSRMLARMRKCKENFWQSDSHLLQHLDNTTCPGSQTALVRNVLPELYRLVGAMRRDRDFDSELSEYRRNVGKDTSELYEKYMNLRKVVLATFSFESVTPLLDGPAFKKIASSLKGFGSVHQPWNLANWCFQGVRIERDSTDKEEVPTEMHGVPMSDEQRQLLLRFPSVLPGIKAQEAQ